MKKVLFGALVALSPVALMADTGTIPDAGVDVAGYITSAIAALGAIVGVAVGGYFAFLGIKSALKWARQALR